MNTVYLVDLENTGTKLMYQHAEQHPDAEYIIFYSDNTSTPGAMLELVPESTHVSFVDCRTGGNNAMDFCICAMAGRLSTGIARKVRILSNDKGYDSMIHMLQNLGIRITREIATYQMEQTEEQAEVSEQHEAEDVESVILRQGALTSIIQKCVPKMYRKEMLKAIPNVMNRKEAHEMCQAILPQNIATEVYRKLRKHIPREVS